MQPAGMPLHLVKPVDPEVLGSILANYANDKAVASPVLGPGARCLPAHA
jgi:hypothetical protein